MKTLITQFELGELFGKQVAQQIQALCTKYSTPSYQKRLTKQFISTRWGYSKVCESTLVLRAWDIEDIITRLQRQLYTKKHNTRVLRWEECIKALVKIGGASY